MVNDTKNWHNWKVFREFKRFTLIRFSEQKSKIVFTIFSFRIDNTDHIIDVNRHGQGGGEYDQASLVQLPEFQSCGGQNGLRSHRVMGLHKPTDLYV